MPSRTFSTVSDKLLEYAEATATYFENHGYKVYVEKRELAFPYTPTLVCKRHGTTIIVEVFSKIHEDRIKAWVAYARSCNHDTRIAIFLPANIELRHESQDSIRTQGVGLSVVQPSFNVVEYIPPRDLALNVQLPPLNTLPRKVQRLLGSAYEQFDRSQWREGFEDACQAFEVEARRYLKAGLRSGRITIMGSKGPRSITENQVDRMTMGQLAHTFSAIQNQNYSDAKIGKALSVINDDRVGVAHHKSKRRTEKSLRSNVGQHMWTIVVVMKEMV